MNRLRSFFRWGMIDPGIEFLSILTWALFFPAKSSHLYFSGFALLTSFILLKNIFIMKTIGLSHFSHFLMVFNFILLLSVFFSNYAFKSIMLLADIFLISCYFALFNYERRKQSEYFQGMAYIISIFSLIDVILYLVPIGQQKHIFFVNPIHEGIISGMGVLLFFYYLLEKQYPRYFLFLIVNLGGVFVSQSKAAFIGVVLFSFLLLLLRKDSQNAQKKPTSSHPRDPMAEMAGTPGAPISAPKDGPSVARPLKWIHRLWSPTTLLVLLVILTFIIPNPIRSMFHYSLKKDPYALERINIWKMSLTIFTDHLWVGVGPDNFSEVAAAYNFKQSHGPANYFKVADIPHNDYLKLMAELGLMGLAMILMLFYFLAKKIFSTSLSNTSTILLLYLLFQAFLFNILFDIFFFYVFLFLLKNVLEQEEDVVYRSFSSPFKYLLSSLLIFVGIFGYLFPWLSHTFMEQAKKSSNLVRTFDLLEKAGRLNPLDLNVYYLKAQYLALYFKQTSNWESFYSAVGNFKKNQRLNPYFINAYLSESDLYIELLKKKIKYISMDEEILAPLERAEQFAPVNPFIKFTKAQVYWEFNKKEKAREEAINAITLEPEYIAALYFLQRNFHYFQEETTFRDKIKGILKKARNLNPEPGHYLFKLYEVPGEYNEEGKKP